MQEAIARVGQQFEVETALACEVLVQNGFRHARGAGDVVHGGAVVALAGEQLERDGEQLIATLARGQAGRH